MVCWFKKFGIIIFIIPKLFQCIPLPFGMNTQEKTKITECVVKIIENIPRRIFKLSILSKGDNILLTGLLKRVQVPVIINARENSREGLDSRVHSDLVIIHNIDVQLALEEVIWHRNTKFFVVYTMERNMADDFRKFWNMKLTNVFGVMDDPRGVRLFSYLPYEGPDCNDTRLILLDTWNGEDFPGGGWSLVNEDIRVKNANGCPMNVSVVYVRPMVIFPENCQCNASKEVDGIEARFLKVFAKELNFTPTYSVPRDGLGWGKIRPSKGVVGEIFRRESDFGFGMLAPLLERHENIDLSRNYNDRECITFAVPAGVGRERLPWFVNVKSGYTLLEFLLIFLSLAAVALINCIAGGLMPVSALIYTLSSFLGQTIALPKRPTLKNLMLLWALFSSVITRIYESSMGSRMTVPSTPPDIKTFQQLIDSDLKLCGYPNMLDVLGVARENHALAVIKERFYVTDFDIDTAVDKIREDRNIAYMSHMSTFLYAVLRDPAAKGHIIPLAQCVYDYYPAIAMQKNSPFTKTIDGIITVLFESGISQHWKSLFLYQVPESVPEVEPVHLEKIMGVFVVLLTGYLIAFFSFLIELGSGFMRRRISSKIGKARRKKSMVRTGWYFRRSELIVTPHRDLRQPCQSYKKKRHSNRTRESKISEIIFDQRTNQ